MEETKVGFQAIYSYLWKLSQCERWPIILQHMAKLVTGVEWNRVLNQYPVEGEHKYAALRSQ